MADLDFPTSPSDGDTYAGYVYNATKGVWQWQVLTTPANGYTFVETVYFTSNGTFSKGDYPWLRAIRVKCQGGGGAGGGALPTTASEVSFGGGGSGGEYAEVFITDIAGLAASVTVTVGAGGVANASGFSGQAGGQSVFGSLEAEGGGRGVTKTAGTPPRVSPLSDAAGSGGAGTADFRVDGQAGQAAHSTDAGLVVSGRGGNSYLGLGGASLIHDSSLAGKVATGFGSGGGGGSNAGSAATLKVGRSGADGIVIVELFA